MTADAGESVLTLRTRVLLAGLAFGLLVVLLVGVAWGLGLSFAGMLLMMLPTFFSVGCVFVGIFFLRRYQRRVGDSVHCARCGYQQPPEGPPGPQCPECGWVWSRRWGTVTGQRVGGRVNLGLAVLVWLLPTLMYLSMMFGGASRWYVRWLPTWALITEVVEAPRGFTQVEWAVLRTRSLDDRQKRRLARGLLDYRKTNGRVADSAVNWLLAERRRGGLPDEEWDRLVSEAATFSIEAPERVTVGQAFAVRLGMRDVHTPLPVGTDFMVVFGGFVGPDGERVGRSDKYHYLNLLDNEKYVIRASMVPAAPGQYALRANVWLLLIPRNAWHGREVRWTDAGEPVLPGGTMHEIHVPIEKAIHVMPENGDSAAP